MTASPSVQPIGHEAGLANGVAIICGSVKQLIQKTHTTRDPYEFKVQF